MGLPDLMIVHVGGPVTTMDTARGPMTTLDTARQMSLILNGVPELIIVDVGRGPVTTLDRAR